MQEFDLDRAIYMAGIYQDDDPLIRDCKFGAWLSSVKGRVVNHRDEPVPDGTEVVVINKGKQNGIESRGNQAGV